MLFYAGKTFFIMHANKLAKVKIILNFMLPTVQEFFNNLGVKSYIIAPYMVPVIYFVLTMDGLIIIFNWIPTHFWGTWGGGG